MNQLQILMKDIKETKSMAERKPSEDTRKRSFELGNIRQAKEKLNRLFMNYRKEILGNSVFLTVTGSQSEEFANIASEEFSCFSFDSEDLYRKLADAVPPQLYQNKEASRNILDHVSNAFEDRAMQIDIIGYNAIIFKKEFRKMLTGKEDLLQLVKKAVNSSVGAEVVGLDAVDKASLLAIDNEFSGKVVPIVLFTKDQELTKELSSALKRINKNVFLVTTGTKIEKSLKDMSLSSIKSVDKESVEKTLTKLKQNVL